MYVSLLLLNQPADPDETLHTTSLSIRECRKVFENRKFRFRIFMKFPVFIYFWLGTMVD